MIGLDASSGKYEWRKLTADFIFVNLDNPSFADAWRELQFVGVTRGAYWHITPATNVSPAVVVQDNYRKIGPLLHEGDLIAIKLTETHLGTVETVRWVEQHLQVVQQVFGTRAIFATLDSFLEKKYPWRDETRLLPQWALEPRGATFDSIGSKIVTDLTSQELRVLGTGRTLPVRSPPSAVWNIAVGEDPPLRTVEITYDADSGGNAFVLVDLDPERVVNVAHVPDQSAATHGYVDIPVFGWRETEGKTEVIVRGAWPSTRSKLKVWALDSN